MPQYRKVPSLQKLALRNVGMTVERLALKVANEVHVDADIQQTSDYLNKLIPWVPHYLYEHIAIEILEGVRRVVLKTSPCITRMNILGKMNEMVLNPQLKCLTISVWPDRATYHFYPNMQNLTGLEKLELVSLPKVLRTAEFYDDLSKSISAMIKLKSFTFKYSCTDAIVQAIGNHCRDIEYLNLEGSHAVTDRSIPHLLKCSNLRVLIVGGSSINIDGMTQIVIGLTNLLEVDYDYFDAVFMCLKDLNCGPFGLRKAQTCDDLKDDLQLFLDMFPKMEYIEFLRPIPNLPILASLDKLKTLIVRMCGIHDDYLKQLLKEKGVNITRLFLDCAGGVDIQHIFDIGLYCPNLSCLGLIDCQFTNGAKPPRRFDEPLFMNLRKIYYAGIGGMEILKFVLSHALNIEVIDVTYTPEFPPDITHSFVENVLSANPMKNLKEFSVSNSTDLNIRTVKLLFESCVNLKFISCLEGWTGISKEELETFKQYISSHNFDLQYVSSPRPTELVCSDN